MLKLARVCSVKIWKEQLLKGLQSASSDTEFMSRNVVVPKVAVDKGQKPGTLVYHQHLDENRHQDRPAFHRLFAFHYMLEAVAPVRESKSIVQAVYTAVAGGRGLGHSVMALCLQKFDLVNLDEVLVNIAVIERVSD